MLNVNKFSDFVKSFSLNHPPPMRVVHTNSRIMFVTSGPMSLIHITSRAMKVYFLSNLKRGRFVKMKLTFV